MAFGLDGKVAIVTGPGGFGIAYCRGLSEAGVRVVIADRQDSGEATLAALRNAGEVARLVPTDVTSEASILDMARTVTDAYGGVDILVNNAALFQGLPLPSSEPLENMPLELWDHVLAINLTATMLVTRAVVPLMRANGGGVIVNQTSPAIWQNPPGWIHYTVSKGAIPPMTRALARELAPENIRVNAIAPGPVVTGDEDQLSAEVARTFMERRCIKRFGTESDIVGPLLFLASEMSSWITGQVLVVDGGGNMLG